MKEKLRLLITLLALAFVATHSFGCASIGRSLKSLVGGKSSENSVPQVTTPRFSDQENLRYGSNRQYRRMNRERFEEEADLKSDAGSLWVMEGQGAYLFSQNQTRMVGDLLNVNIEGAPRTQLETKVRVIARLLERLENPMRGLASKQAAQKNAETPANNGAQDAANPGPPGEPESTENKAAEAPASSSSPNLATFNVQSVPTRIVEQIKDGSYRVRGMQPFMIGKREYKVIVTGIVRPEDFDEDGLDSSKLLDPQFDIVSARKGASL